MGIEMPASYYDAKIPTVIPESKIRLYNIVCGLLGAFKRNITILDIGCGNGWLADFLAPYGFTEYTGVDFSSECLKLASNKHPYYKWLCKDAFDKEIMDLMPLNRVVIMTEFLEHIEKDLEFVQKIPQGRIVILSVPNTPDEAHVRWFDKLEGVMERYEKHIRFEFVSTLASTRKGKLFHILQGVVP